MRNSGRTFAAILIGFAIAGAAVSVSRPAYAQNAQMKDDVEQFAMDLHTGMDRSSLTEQQKEQIRGDLKRLREARQNHDRMAGFEAIRNFRSILNSGAFKPE